MEAGKATLGGSFIQGTKWKIDHKEEYAGVSSNTKLCCIMDRNWVISNGDITSKLKKNIDRTTVTLNSKINSKNEISAKVSHLLKYWNKFRLKYMFEGERKNGNMMGLVGLNLLFKRSYSSITRIPFLTSYSE
jgi:hypothetical protein